jgi:Transposase
MFVGIDWAADAHEVCAVDAAGAIRHRATIPHSQDGLDQLVGHLGRWAGEASCWWGSNAPKGGWWTGSWRPATRSCWSPPSP